MEKIALTFALCLVAEIIENAAARSSSKITRAAAMLIAAALAVAPTCKLL